MVDGVEADRQMLDPHKDLYTLTPDGHLRLIMFLFYKQSISLICGNFTRATLRGFANLGLARN